MKNNLATSSNNKKRHLKFCMKASLNVITTDNIFKYNFFFIFQREFHFKGFIFYLPFNSSVMIEVTSIAFSFTYKYVRKYNLDSVSIHRFITKCKMNGPTVWCGILTHCTHLSVAASVSRCWLR